VTKSHHVIATNSDEFVIANNSDELIQSEKRDV